jgi:hypothetical protein
MDAAAKAGRMAILLAMAARMVFAQAALPTAYTGPWKLGEPPEGWTFTGLGEDVTPDFDGYTNGAARLQNTGSSIAIHCADSPAEVSYWIKGLTYSGGTFRVEQSADGTNWTALATYTELDTNAMFQSHTPWSVTRHIRFFYTEKVTGNVGIDGVSISKFDFVLPEIAAIVATGGVASVSVAETVVGRTYTLEHALSLLDAPVLWSSDDAGAGTGGGLVLHDGAATNSVRHYRVVDTTP